MTHHVPDTVLDASLLTARRQARDNSAEEHYVQHVNMFIAKHPSDEHFHISGYHCSDWEDGTTIETWVKGRLQSAKR